MPLSDIVAVNVVAQNPGVTRAGFGVLLLLSQTAAWSERTRTYSSASEVSTDFATTTPEYNAANKAFSQSPSPTSIMIGRANTSPVTQRWAAEVVAATVGTEYALNVLTAADTALEATHTAVASVAWVALTVYAKGDLVTNDSGKGYVCITAGTAAGAGGPTGTTADITDGTVHWMYAGAIAVGAASNDAIAYNLQLAIEALVGLPSIGITLQGSVEAKTLRALATGTGIWFALETHDPAALSIAQDHAAPAASALATDLNAIKGESNDFYGVVSLYNSELYVADVASWCESNEKLYIVASADTECATVAEGVYATDALHDLKANSYARSCPIFHPRASEFMDAAETGRFFPISPGGDNWRLKTLSGVTSGWGNGTQFTSTQITNIKAKRANFYYVLGGATVIGGDGKVSANEYIDVVRGRDWWVARMGERLANLLIQSEKVPFTAAGISLVEAQVRAQNEEGIKAGLINPGSPPDIAAPIVTVPTSGSVSAANRAARNLPDVNTIWTLAGAINAMTVNAQVTA